MSTENQFAGLGLAEPLLRAVADTGYTSPTPIQLKAIPLVLGGLDLLAAAQTGTGKTAGFVLPILHRLIENPLTGTVRPGRPRCLILTPTRELAAQVEESVRTYGKHVDVKSMVIFGGVGIQPQIAQLRKRLDIVVATPGRLLDHAGQKTVDLAGVEILVLDEGDRMLDMGFIHDIKRILALLPKTRQSMLFSATFSDDVRALANQLLNKPGCVDVAPRNTASELVEQTVHLVPKDHKRDLLSHLIRENKWEQVLVFTRTKHGANRLAEKLERDGIPAAAIHGNKSQGARTRALAQFKAGEVPVLVATDIAARGLDIVELPHVVNFELPNVAEDYVHRIGRTGRAGSSGSAVSLVDPEELPLLRDIEKLLKQSIKRVTAEGFVPPAKSANPEREDERPRGRQQQPRQNREPRARAQREPRNSPQREPRRNAAPAQQAAGQPRDDSRGNREQQPRGESRGGRSQQPRSDSRGNRPQQPRRAEGDRPQHPRRSEGDRNNRSRSGGRGEADGNTVRRQANSGGEADGNRARPQSPQGEVDGNRLPTNGRDRNREPRDDSFGNRIQHHPGQRNRGPGNGGEVDGNRGHHPQQREPVDGNRADSDAPTAREASEAARHQAQPQPALFAPRPQARRR
jgi:ATP-dependent RNA helicase RhlE